jgi:hypothetical protein
MLKIKLSKSSVLIIKKQIFFKFQIMAEYGGGDLLVLSQAKLVNEYKLNDVDVDTLICNDKNCAIHNGKQNANSFIKATLNRNSIKRVNSGVYNKIEEAVCELADEFDTTEVAW